MLDIGLSEFFIIGAVALLVVGPKELPMLMARIGRWTGKARAMARHARAGFDTMVREAEIEEMNKRWEAENARIMAATSGQVFAEPLAPQLSHDPGTPAAPPEPPGDDDPVTVLPGLDGDASDPHRLARLQDRAPAARADTPGADPTDWRDPPAPEAARAPDAAAGRAEALGASPPRPGSTPAAPTVAASGGAARPAADGPGEPAPQLRRPRKARSARAADAPPADPPAAFPPAP